MSDQSFLQGRNSQGQSILVSCILSVLGIEHGPVADLFSQS